MPSLNEIISLKFTLFIMKNFKHKQKYLSHKMLKISYLLLCAESIVMPPLKTLLNYLRKSTLIQYYHPSQDFIQILLTVSTISFFFLIQVTNQK